MRYNLTKGFFGVALAALLLLGFGNSTAQAQILMGGPGFNLSIGGVYPGVGFYSGIPAYGGYGYGYGMAPGYGYYGYPSYGYSGYGVPYGYGYSSYQSYGYPGAWGTYRSYSGFPGFGVNRSYSYRARVRSW